MSLSKKAVNRPYLIARYYKNGKVIGKIGRFRKRAFLQKVESKLTTGSADTVYFRIEYNKNKDEYNDGFYKSVEDFRNAYEIFTEQFLIDYINEKEYKDGRPS